MKGSWARITNLLLGSWLFVSAFAWYHAPAHFNNSWVCGLLGAAFALLSLAVPRVRLLNTALAVWIVVSTLALPALDGPTLWNNLVVALLMFALSLVPETSVHAGGWSHHRRIPV